MKAAFRPILLVLAVLLAISGSLLSLGSGVPVIDNNLTIATLLATQQSSLIGEGADIDAIPFQDNQQIYKDEDPSSVITIFVTIKSEDSESWAFMNDYNHILPLPTDVTTSTQKNRIEAIVRFGDDSGPLPTEFGYEDILPNATIEIRGTNLDLDPQKSYKITLFDGSGVWRGQSIINLNKHLSDETRFRNKLSFDLMRQIPNLVGLRTQFVHLYVSVESDAEDQNVFVDYGLFTQIEQPNKRFLESRLLDRDGQLYKASNFLFNEYPGQIRLVNDPLYDESAFSQILEIKGDKDHSKLIQMLRDINNEGFPIEESFGRYFDADNYFTWMAYNILIGNVEVVSQNYLLYSPKNGNKWYFIPWDYDKAFPLQSDVEISTKYYLPWQKGVSNYWESTLHRRVLKESQYRSVLERKLDELFEILSPDKINSLIGLYQPIIDKYSFAMPDAYYMPVDINTSHRIGSLISSDVSDNYDMYVESLESPMPFSLGSPSTDGMIIAFTWSESYDLGDRDISYQFDMASDWAFNDMVYSETVTTTKLEIPLSLLSSGKYFWRVMAINSLGKAQFSYDYYIDVNSEVHPGVKAFYITLEGEVLE